MDRYVIEHLVPRQAEGTYYTIGFAVPAGLEQVTVSYSYTRLPGKPGRPGGIVDLGLMDADGRFLGWSGSARGAVFVGPYAATNGYLMADIGPGEWRILVGAYKIPDGGLPVRYEIAFTPRGPRWLTGDLHIHSNASDGRHDIYTLTRMAQRAGLDFIAVANHNNYSENLHLPVVPGLALLPAVEWTHYRGHMNFFGVTAPFENSFVVNSEEEMLALVESAKEKGALVSVNHPRCGICPYLWKSEDCFDLVEVWNGPMRRVNLDGITWWHSLLAAGRRVPLVGGSDYHGGRSPARLARPVTRVWAPSPQAADILEAIGRGHSYVTAKPGGPGLQLRCGGAMMGDVVPGGPAEGRVLEVEAHGLRPGMRLRLVTNEGTAAEWRRFARGALKARLPVEKAWRFAYLVAARPLFGMEFVRAIGNPLYFTGAGWAWA